MTLYHGFSSCVGLHHANVNKHFIPSQNILIQRKVSRIIWVNEKISYRHWMMQNVWSVITYDTGCQFFKHNCKKAYCNRKSIALIMDISWVVFYNFVNSSTKGQLSTYTRSLKHHFFIIYPKDFMLHARSVQAFIFPMKPSSQVLVKIYISNYLNIYSFIWKYYSQYTYKYKMWYDSR